MQPSVIRFETEPGFYIYAEGWGDVSAPPLLLLHGGGQTHHSWGDTARALAERGWYAVTYDARGHGSSSWSVKGNYLVDALVSDLNHIIHQIGGKPALIGASMGGITAMILEGEVQGMASAIVLADIAPKAEQKGIERIFAFMSAHLESGFASLEEAAAAVAAYLPQRAKEYNYSRLEKNLRFRNGRYYWHWDPTMLKAWKNATPDQQTAHEDRMFSAAQQLKVPTLIVRGGMSDVVSDRVMAEFLDAVPHVRSLTVSGAGHMVAGDSNHAFTRAVIQFLEEVYPGKENRISE
ncbi:alpha/beta fold hydrolase [Runella slithyformis]|uniref:Alpha/beta hydrolase fold protein n=1 Tax=Runella slithyformis (strain ATCC 29530 / DSM 19594 / LMG 11500 / NCIMB 11436 / LSU 4) TaxID=761193 RepID=A0A7U3ZPF2_RUNSL|nr:alpha/beta hydrolase [Runella slithyformis]AEI50952.1 alpha/beta hydrolase fold protein [Runella slithyformis DSM 19594]